MPTFRKPNCGKRGQLKEILQKETHKKSGVNNMGYGILEIILKGGRGELINAKKFLCSWLKNV